MAERAQLQGMDDDLTRVRAGVASDASRPRRKAAATGARTHRGDGLPSIAVVSCGRPSPQDAEYHGRAAPCRRGRGPGRSGPPALSRPRRGAKGSAPGPAQAAVVRRAGRARARVGVPGDPPRTRRAGQGRPGARPRRSRAAPARRASRGRAALRAFPRGWTRPCRQRRDGRSRRRSVLGRGRCGRRLPCGPRRRRAAREAPRRAHVSRRSARGHGGRGGRRGRDLPGARRPPAAIRPRDPRPAPHVARRDAAAVAPARRVPPAGAARPGGEEGSAARGERRPGRARGGSRRALPFAACGRCGLAASG